MRRLWAVYQGETKIATFDNKEGAKICQQRVGGEIVEMVEARALVEVDWDIIINGRTRDYVSRLVLGKD